MSQEAVTLKVEGKYAQALRQALSYRWSSLDKMAKKNEADGITCDARERMVILEEIMREMEPQTDLIDEITRPPEAYN